MEKQQTPIDLLITSAHILPLASDTQRPKILSPGCIAINQGRIIDLGEPTNLKARYLPKETLELKQHTLIPGLINSHTHAPMSLFRGMADDLPLMTWLNDHIWPAEGRWISPEFIQSGTELAIAEMLLCGITSFTDMYFYPEVVAKVATQAGIRTQLAFPILDFPTTWAKNTEEYLEQGLQLWHDFNNHPLVYIGLGPHAPYTVSDESLKRVAALAEEYNTFIQMHIHETSSEVEQSLKDYGKRPLQRLAELNLLSPRLQAVHMTQLTDADFQLLQKSGTQVIHCPESNLKLASGFCPVVQLLAQEINVAIGTDGAASNNDLDLLGEIKTAALLAKGHSQNAKALPAEQALRLATTNAAQALGLAQEIGSLEVGKAADIVAIDLNALNTQPLYEVNSQLVYSAHNSQITHVWVAGQLLVKDRELQTLSMPDILLQCKNWQKKISETGIL